VTEIGSPLALSAGRVLVAAGPQANRTLRRLARSASPPILDTMNGAMTSTDFDQLRSNGLSALKRIRTSADADTGTVMTPIQPFCRSPRARP